MLESNQVQPVISSVVTPVALEGFKTPLLNKYPGAAAAYSLRRLKSWDDGKRVVEVRRSSDSTTQDFSASQITGGQMLDFVNNDTTSLYNSARYFDGASTVVNLTSPITLNSTGDYLELNYFSSVTNRKGIAATAGGAHIDFTSGSANIGIFDDTGASSIASCPMVLNTLTKLRIERAADGSFDVYQNEVLTGSTAILGNVSLNKIGRNRFSASRWNGILTDVDFNNQAAYTGLGTSVTAWEDTIGSNDGTEVNGEAYTGTISDGFVSTRSDQSGATLRDATQATTTEQIKIVDAGAVVLDGNGNVSTLWDGVDDDLDVLAGFAGLTAANVYAVTDNAGVVTIDTLTAQDISSATNWTTILSSLTYQKVTALSIYPDATDQAGIESALSDLFE